MALRDAFAARLGPCWETLLQVVDLFPGVCLSAVDRRCRIMAFNRANLENCNFASEEDVVGRRLHDVFPKSLADLYAARHRKVQRTGRPDALGTYGYAADRSTDARTVSMFPLRGTDGKIAGSANISWRAGAGPADIGRYGAVRDAISWIDANLAEKITDAALAKVSNMSVSSFRRAFAETMDMTPAAYVRTARVNRARKLLETTDMTVAAIAAECNFCDVSHFVKTFRRLRGKTPSEYRFARIPNRGGSRDGDRPIWNPWRPCGAVAPPRRFGYNCPP